MKGYVYYSTQRPIRPGTCPSKGILKVCNYSYHSPIACIGAAWGAVVYDHELDFKEAAEYELKFGGETEVVIKELPEMLSELQAFNGFERAKE